MRSKREKVARFPPFGKTGLRCCLDVFHVDQVGLDVELAGHFHLLALERLGFLLIVKLIAQLAVVVFQHELAFFLHDRSAEGFGVLRLHVILHLGDGWLIRRCILLLALRIQRDHSGCKQQHDAQASEEILHHEPPSHRIGLACTRSCKLHANQPSERAFFEIRSLAVLPSMLPSRKFSPPEGKFVAEKL